MKVKKSEGKRVKKSESMAMAMACSDLFLLLLPLLLLLLSSPLFADALCTTSVAVGSSGTAMTFEKCVDLPAQNATLAWTLDAENSSIQVAFSGMAPSASGWLGWGLNPTSPQMAGTQAFIAFTQSGLPVLHTYNVTIANKLSATPLLPGDISLDVLDKQVRISGASMTIYAHLKLAPGQQSLNHVWNRGISINGTIPSAHGFTSSDLTSIEVLNMTANASTIATPPASSTASSSCSNSFTVSGAARTFANCLDLKIQEANLAWLLDSANNSIEIVFSGTAPSSSGWVGWGINLGATPQMTGTQTFIAFLDPAGTTTPTLRTYNLTGPIKGGSPLNPGAIDLNVLDQQVQISGANMAIYVKLKLNPGQTRLNHVWNRGPSVNAELQPTIHSISGDGLLGVSIIDMLTGTGSTTASSGMTLRNVHGVINTVAFGALFPLGVMSARYLKPFSDPLWFYLHLLFQCSAFILGVSGWATGLKLGDQSEGIVRHKHRAIGITLFAISTLQVMALLLRPKKDHKVRKFWNVYHHSIGYSIIVLGIINIFEGFEILQPAGKFRNAYIGVLISLGAISFILEILTWTILLLRKKKESSKAYGTAPNGHFNGQ